jgi:hypothetical protein
MQYEWLHKSIKYSDFNYTTGEGLCRKPRAKERDPSGQTYMNETQMNRMEGLKNLREHERSNDDRARRSNGSSNRSYNGSSNGTSFDGSGRKNSPNGKATGASGQHGQQQHGQQQHEAIDDLGPMLTHGGISLPTPMSVALHEQTFGLVDLNKEKGFEDAG